MQNLLVRGDNNYYLIVDGGWVYEGELNEIKKVLLEYPVTMDDFYLFPKDYICSLCELPELINQEEKIILYEKN